MNLQSTFIVSCYEAADVETDGTSCEEEIQLSRQIGLEPVGEDGQVAEDMHIQELARGARLQVV